MLCGIFQDIQVIVHHLGIVREEEVNFYSGNANALQPGEFFLAVLRGVEPVLRLRGAWANPGGPGVVPQVYLDSFFFGIVHKFLNASVFHIRPLPVYEAVRPAHIRGKVYEFHVQVEELGAVVVGPVNPGRNSRLYPGHIGNLARRTEVRDKRGFSNVSKASYHNHPPGRKAVAEGRRARQLHVVVLFRGTIVQGRCAVPVADVSL